MVLTFTFIAKCFKRITNFMASNADIFGLPEIEVSLIVLLNLRLLMYITVETRIADLIFFIPELV